MGQRHETHLVSTPCLTPCLQLCRILFVSSLCPYALSKAKEQADVTAPRSLQMRYGARGLRGVLGSAWGGEQHGNRKVGRAVPVTPLRGVTGEPRADYKPPRRQGRQDYPLVLAELAVQSKQRAQSHEYRLQGVLTYCESLLFFLIRKTGSQEFVVETAHFCTLPAFLDFLINPRGGKSTVPSGGSGSGASAPFHGFFEETSACRA